MHFLLCRPASMSHPVGSGCLLEISSSLLPIFGKKRRLWTLDELSGPDGIMPDRVPNGSIRVSSDGRSVAEFHDFVGGEGGGVVTQIKCSQYLSLPFSLINPFASSCLYARTFSLFNSSLTVIDYRYDISAQFSLRALGSCGSVMHGFCPCVDYACLSAAPETAAVSIGSLSLQRRSVQSQGMGRCTARDAIRERARLNRHRIHKKQAHQPRSD